MGYRILLKQYWILKTTNQRYESRQFFCQKEATCLNVNKIDLFTSQFSKLYFVLMLSFSRLAKLLFQINNYKLIAVNSRRLEKMNIYSRALRITIKHYFNLTELKGVGMIRAVTNNYYAITH